MRRVLALAGVDYVQWHALMRAYRLIDWGPLAGGYDSKQTLFAVFRVLLTVGFFSIAGAGPALIVLAARDPMVGAVATTAVTMWLTAASLLLQASSLVLPDDYALIGFRPVTSRTYFAVRLGALLSQSFEMAALTGWIPVLAFMARSDGSWRLALAAAAAIIASTLFVTLAIVAVCSSLLVVMSPRRLQRIFQYAQVVVLLGITLAYTLVWMAIVTSGRAAITAHADFLFPRRAALLALPPTWFGSYVALAAGSLGRFDVAAALLSLVSVAAVTILLRGRLSTDYAVRVAQLATEPSAPVRVVRARRAWLGGERRAIAVLVGGQLRGDLAVQSGALMAIVTNVIVLVGAGATIGLPRDPFVNPEPSIVEFFLLFMVTNFYDTLTRSHQFEASWPFFTTPADRAALLAGSRDMIAFCLLAPMLPLFGALFLYAFGHPGHALTHLAVVALAAYLNVQIHVILRPWLPFSQSFRPGQRAFIRGLLAMPAVAAGAGIIVLFEYVLYRSALATAIGLAALAGLVIAFNRVTRWRAGHRAAAYAG